MSTKRGSMGNVRSRSAKIMILEMPGSALFLSNSSVETRHRMKLFQTLNAQIWGTPRGRFSSRSYSHPHGSLRSLDLGSECSGNCGYCRADAFGGAPAILLQISLGLILKFALGSVAIQALQVLQILVKLNSVQHAVANIIQFFYSGPLSEMAPFALRFGALK